MQPPQLLLERLKICDFYDHEAHIYIHNTFRKFNLYDELLPEMQQLVDEHVQEHMDALNVPMEGDEQQQREQDQELQHL